jgi:hypothetical protein
MYILGLTIKKLDKTNASVQATRNQCGSFLMKPCQTLFCFTNGFFFKRFGRELTVCQNKTTELVQVST